MHLIGVKTIEEPLSRWPKGGCSRLIEVVATYSEGFIYSMCTPVYYTDIAFRKLITGHLIWGGHLIGVPLYLIKHGFERIKKELFLIFVTATQKVHDSLILRHLLDKAVHSKEHVTWFEKKNSLMLHVKFFVSLVTLINFEMPMGRVSF